MNIYTEPYCTKCTRSWDDFEPYIGGPEPCKKKGCPVNKREKENKEAAKLFAESVVKRKL